MAALYFDEENKMNLPGTISLVDIYATKGVEYLIVIVFFICFAYFAKKIIMDKPWRRLKVIWAKNKDVQSDSDKI